MKIRHISTRFALLLGVAAVVPLVAYGLVSILSLQRGTRESVVNGNQNVAVRAAEEIRRYVVTNAELLKALWRPTSRTPASTSASRIRFSRTTCCSSASSARSRCSTSTAR